VADDDIKPDAEDSAEEIEAIAAENAAEGDEGTGEAATKQSDAAAAAEAQAPAEADAVADDTAQAADAEATDPNLSDSDDGADEPDAEDGASGDGNDAVAEESLDAAGDTDDDLDTESADVTESAESAESSDAGDSAESEDSEDSAEDSEEEAVDEDLPPPGPPKPEEPKDDCPKCAGGGAPAWMATFADMATLLMAFFVLLLSFAETEVPKFKQVAGSLKQAFGIEKIVPKVTIPMARSIVVENFTPAVAERSVMDVKEQRSDFVRGDFIEKKTEEGEYEDPIESDFQQVQEALEQELNKGMADVRIENGEIKVTLVEPAAAGGKAGNEGEGKGGQVAQETLDAVAKVAEVSATLSSKVGVHLADQAQGNQSGASATRRQSRTGDGSGMSKYDRLRADLSDEIAAGLAEVEKDGDKIIVRLASQGSFTSGSSDLRQAFTPTLTRLGNSLAQYPGSVMVEGHTDNVPVAFSERFKSNWDLSAARAASIADFLLTSTNLEGGNVQIAGFADTRPLDTNDTSTGRARNRRIEVIVDDN
jgi:chemotaxis protein MotB